MQTIGTIVTNIVATPLAALLIIFLAALGLSWGLRRLAIEPRSKGSRGLEPYACGEIPPAHMAVPDYGQFFPFAFFFTILHVVALMVTTVPAAPRETITTFVMAIIYLLGAVVGLTVLYRR